MLEFGLLGPWVGEHDCHSCKINGSLPLWAAKNYTAAWCNGNTQVFGACILGSNPCAATIMWPGTDWLSRHPFTVKYRVRISVAILNGNENIVRVAA